MGMPLDGYRVIDLTWQGPGPHCAMMLAELGARVIVVDDGSPAGLARRAETRRLFAAGVGDYARRNARRIALDLKAPLGQEALRRLLASADVLLEGFRPGVAERLGLGAEAVRRAYPRVVYCSISGYGQHGPYRSRAGHDINYLALGGLLGLTGTPHGEPALPGTIVADLAAGGLPAAVAILAALLERERTGRGQVVDVSMQEGVAALLGPMLALRAAGEPMTPAGTALTGAAPWYGIYETADGRYITLGALEPWLFAGLCERLGRPEWAAMHAERAAWPELRAALTDAFRSRTLADWRADLEDGDGCVAGMLTIDETLDDPQLAARHTFAIGPEGMVHVRGLPRMSSLPDAPHVERWQAPPGADTDELLAELGFSHEERAAMRSGGSA